MLNIQTNLIQNSSVPYLALARTLELIEATSARLKITEILSNFLRSVIVLSPDNLLFCVYLCLNKLAPAFEGLELGLAEKSLMKAVSQSSGRSNKQVLEELDSTGDLGIVAQNSCGRQTKLFKPAALTVPKVFNQLKEIASMKGRDVIINFFCSLGTNLYFFLVNVEETGESCLDV